MIDLTAILEARSIEAIAQAATDLRHDASVYRALPDDQGCKVAQRLERDASDLETYLLDVRGVTQG